MKQWTVAKQVIERIEQAGFEAVIVGGAVRDYYMGKQNADVDVATSALPLEVKALFTQTIDVGIEHGTVLVTQFDEPIEVTTYRTETTYSDHRRPDEVVFVRNLKDDLQRRDFTMNAMAINGNNEIIDYYGGKSDIDHRCIRAVGEPIQRFTEDALRMLRAIRFSAQLGFEIEHNTLLAIETCAPTIEHVAVERVYVELSKLFASSYVTNGLHYFEKSTLANYLPGNIRAELWTNFEPTDALKGWSYFYLLNAEQHPDLMKQYRTSKKEEQFVKKVYKAYEALLQQWQPIDYFTYDEEILKMCVHFAHLQRVDVSISATQAVANKKALPIHTVQQLAVNGRHFMEWHTGKKGPWVKDALQGALKEVLSGTIKNDVNQIKEWFLHDFVDEGSIN